MMRLAVALVVPLPPIYLENQVKNELKHFTPLFFFFCFCLFIFFFVFSKQKLFTENMGNPVMITVKVGTVVGKNYSVARVLPLLFSFLIEYLIL